MFSCLLMADNKYVFCSVYLLPAAVALVTNCVIGVVMVVKLCHGRCCARFGDKAGSMTVNTLANRVSIKLKLVLSNIYSLSLVD